jgi:acyl carrier protein
MVLAAGANIFKSNNLVLEEVSIEQSLILPKDEAKTVQLILTPEGTAYSFQIFSLTTDEDNLEPFWIMHAWGKVLVNLDPEPLQADLATKHQYTEEISVKDYYQKLRQRGVDHGPSFQAIEQLFWHDGVALGQIRLPEAFVDAEVDYQLHPVLLDACCQILGAKDGDEHWMPVGLERLKVYRRPSTRLWIQAQCPLKGSNQHLTANLQLFDENGDVVAQVEGLSLKRASREALLHGFQSYLQGQVALALELSVSQIDVQQPLNNMGLDSLMAVELKNQIAVDLKTNLPMSLFIAGDNIVQIATLLLEQVTAENSSQDSDDLEKFLAELEQISEDEAEVLLSQENVNSSVQKNYLTL